MHCGKYAEAFVFNFQIDVDIFCDNCYVFDVLSTLYFD